MSKKPLISSLFGGFQRGLDFLLIFWQTDMRQTNLVENYKFSRKVLWQNF